MTAVSTLRQHADEVERIVRACPVSRGGCEVLVTQVGGLRRLADALERGEVPRFTKNGTNLRGWLETLARQRTSEWSNLSSAARMAFGTRAAELDEQARVALRAARACAHAAERMPAFAVWLSHVELMTGASVDMVKAAVMFSSEFHPAAAADEFGEQGGTTLPQSPDADATGG